MWTLQFAYLSSVQPYQIALIWPHFVDRQHIASLEDRSQEGALDTRDTGSGSRLESIWTGNPTDLDTQSMVWKEGEIFTGMFLPMDFHQKETAWLEEGQSVAFCMFNNIEMLNILFWPIEK